MKTKLHVLRELALGRLRSLALTGTAALLLLALCLSTPIPPKAQVSPMANVVYASQLPGNTVGEKVTAAKQQCSSDTNVPCVIVIDPILSVFAQGTLPAVAAHEIWWDYRFGSVIYAVPPAGSTLSICTDVTVGPCIQLFATSTAVGLSGIGAPITFNGNIASSGVNSGFKHFNFAGCTTAASVGATCDATGTWPNAFADGGYNVVCTGEGVASGVPAGGGTITTSATTVSYRTIAVTAAAAGFSSIACVGIHP